MAEPQKGIPDPTLSALLDEAEAIQARIREYLVACAAPPVQPLDNWNNWPADAGHADHVKPSKMARREGCSVTTITRRCEPKASARSTMASIGAFRFGAMKPGRNPAQNNDLLH
ncbi:hypothetical protein [Methylobacterium sp. V23]|uniref:hypothetical protein n=1 Tax=Methylobacterium sp. V23 TaxID=2044878 RepID=UPI0011AFDEAD|nr:hypothetical protein [Methylobacterium sp. V23]